MSVYEWLKNRDKAIADRTAQEERYFSLSPTRWSLYRKLHPLMRQYLRGCCLDAGAGRMAYAANVRDYTDEYISMDVSPRPGHHLTGSVMELPLRDESLDSILCAQVLEHVPDPERAFREFFRCLKPGGTVLVSVPHLAYLHNEPHDYLRFTKHGLRAFMERAGFTVLDVVPAGGVVSFAGHVPAMIVKALFFPIPGVNRLVIALNGWFSKTVVWIDDRVETRKLFALNFIATAQKPHEDRHRD